MGAEHILWSQKHQIWFFHNFPSFMRSPSPLILPERLGRTLGLTYWNFLSLDLWLWFDVKMMSWEHFRHLLPSSLRWTESPHSFCRSGVNTVPTVSTVFCTCVNTWFSMSVHQLPKHHFLTSLSNTASPILSPRCTVLFRHPRCKKFWLLLGTLLLIYWNTFTWVFHPPDFEGKWKLVLDPCSLFSPARLLLGISWMNVASFCPLRHEINLSTPLPLRRFLEPSLRAD